VAPDARKLQGTARPFSTTALAAALAILFTLGLASLCISPDDVSLIMASDPVRATQDLMLMNGRVIGWALGYLYEFFGIDPLRAPILFFTALVGSGIFVGNRLARLVRTSSHSDLITAVAVVSFFTSTAFLELVSYRHALDIYVVSLVSLGLTLHALTTNGTLHPRNAGILALAGALSALSYQPTVTAQVFLIGWWVMWAASVDRTRPAVSVLCFGISATLLVVAGATAAFLSAKTVFAALGVTNFLTRAVGQVAVADVPKLVETHASAVLGVLSLPSGTYKDRLPSFFLLMFVAAAASTVFDSFRARREFGSTRAVVALLALAGLITIIQNPENMLTTLYWPSLRSSYYLALLGPLIGLLVFQTRPGLGAVVLGVSAVTSIGASLIAMSSWLEIQRRDHAVANDIKSQILAQDPAGRVKKISFQDRIWVSWPDASKGVQYPLYDWSSSVFMPEWSQATFLEYSTGLKLEKTGRSECSSRIDFSRRVVVVTIVDDVAKVCLR
jgi:hypothetical protein